MATTKYYAWSPIRYGAERDKVDPTIITRHSVAQFGDEVSAKSLGLSDEQFDQLVEAAAVRAYAPPEMSTNSTQSPVEHLRNQARRAAEALNHDVDTSEEMAQAAMASMLAASGAGLEEPNEEDDE